MEMWSGIWTLRNTIPLSGFIFLGVICIELLIKFIQKKKINFKGWGTFHKLYKTEKFIYYIENFIILNMPCIGKEMFKLRLLILKVLKKR